MKKTAFICPNSYSIWLFRKKLAKLLMKNGYEVICIAHKDRYASKLEQIGIKFIPVNFERFFSVNKDIKLIVDLYKILKKNKIDVVHNFTIKANIYGSISASLAGIPKIYNSVTGLGFLYRYEWEKGLKIRFIKILISILYFIASHISNKTWFQNQDDIDFFLKHKLINPRKTVLVKGSGIDTKYWQVQKVNKKYTKRLITEIGVDAENIVIMMVCRVIEPKGPLEFISAAEILKTSFPKAKFILVGGIGEIFHNSLNETFLKKKMLEPGSNFFWLGHRSDIRELLAIADIFVLPSYYREGVPRTLLEAMSLSIPIVTTNNVGCKEVVEDGWNGFIVPPRNSAKLALRLEELCKDIKMRRVMGENGREKAVTEFDEEFIAESLLEKLYNNFIF